MTKFCNICQTTKPVSEWNKHPKTKDRLQNCCRRCTKEAHKKWYDTSPGVIKNYALRTKYNITEAQYEQMCEGQNSVCAICKQQEADFARKSNTKRKALAVDHCHKTGKIRGLLCRRCNTALGTFKDSVVLLSSAIKYLEEC